jgi:uncharacterized membrane protein YidH (DUF202 family)
MSRRGKIMVGGAIIMAIGIVVIIFGYDKYQSMASAFSAYEDAGGILAFAQDKGAPPGVVVTTIGILIVAIGMFISIHGFGQMEENRKLQGTK